MSENHDIRVLIVMSIFAVIIVVMSWLFIAAASIVAVNLCPMSNLWQRFTATRPRRVTAYVYV